MERSWEHNNACLMLTHKINLNQSKNYFDFKCYRIWITKATAMSDEEFQQTAEYPSKIIVRWYEANLFDIVHCRERDFKILHELSFMMPFSFTIMSMYNPGIMFLSGARSCLVIWMGTVTMLMCQDGETYSLTPEEGWLKYGQDCQIDRVIANSFLEIIVLMYCNIDKSSNSQHMFYTRIGESGILYELHPLTPYSYTVVFDTNGDLHQIIKSNNKKESLYVVQYPLRTEITNILKNKYPVFLTECDIKSLIINSSSSVLYFDYPKKTSLVTVLTTTNEKSSYIKKLIRRDMISYTYSFSTNVKNRLISTRLVTDLILHPGPMLQKFDTSPVNYETYLNPDLSLSVITLRPSHVALSCDMTNIIKVYDDESHLICFHRSEKLIVLIFSQTIYIRSGCNKHFHIEIVSCENSLTCTYISRKEDGTPIEYKHVTTYSETPVITLEQLKKSYFMKIYISDEFEMIAQEYYGYFLIEEIEGRKTYTVSTSNSVVHNSLCVQVHNYKFFDYVIMPRSQCYGGMEIEPSFLSTTPNIRYLDAPFTLLIQERDLYQFKIRLLDNFDSYCILEKRFNVKITAYYSYKSTYDWLIYALIAFVVLMIILLCITFYFYYRKNVNEMVFNICIHQAFLALTSDRLVSQKTELSQKASRNAHRRL
ncbi:unnamed protein product [Didymodactylos carnosus]|uniref:Uncharacterized protein n=2 Tax=Didymodactylos carnosus TaxID=1234261 RepID=A0A813V8S1_9BILA|nr:unnamed protein product [Didymodactylos carnosus]CAF3625587.1 unnamed protein product [Didymodactylos carnosus]